MRRAFTIVEMLGVSALAAVLLTAALTVTASLGRSSASLSRRHERSPWPASLMRSIRWDLIHAKTLESGADTAQMRTNASLDPESLEPIHRPAELIYSIRVIANRRWLVRTQTLFADDGTHESWTTLVSPDVRSFSIRSATPLTRPATGPSAQAMPRVVEVNIRSSIAGAANLHETVVLR